MLKLCDSSAGKPRHPRHRIVPYIGIRIVLYKCIGQQSVDNVAYPCAELISNLRYFPVEVVYPGRWKINHTA
ncbi:MAG: hypothetical protein WC568_00200 [Candidatus Methanoperedens sp.]